MLKKLWGAFVDGLVDKWKSSLFKKKIQEDCEYHSLFETKMTKINTLFMTKMTTIHTLWGHTYLHSPLRGVPPPPPVCSGLFPMWSWSDFQFTKWVTQRGNWKFKWVYGYPSLEESLQLMSFSRHGSKCILLSLKCTNLLFVAMFTVRLLELGNLKIDQSRHKILIMCNGWWCFPLTD